MARKPDINVARREAQGSLSASKRRYERALKHYERTPSIGHDLLGRIAMMTAVDVQAAWGTYAEELLVVALTHRPQPFVDENGTVGPGTLTRRQAADFLREGSEYFSFRQVADLISRGDQFVGEKHNPFRNIAPVNRRYLDALAATQDYIVHPNRVTRARYKRRTAKVYRLENMVEPHELLRARERRCELAKGSPRVLGLVEVVRSAVHST